MLHLNTLFTNELTSTVAVFCTTLILLSITVSSAVPLTVIASASNVPSTSTSPEKSPVAASNSPVKVTFLNPVISLLLSTATALLATTVPSVVPSK